MPIIVIYSLIYYAQVVGIEVDTHTRRLLLAELIIFLTLAGTTALLFRPLMGVINGNIEIVRETIIKQGESFLGRPIRYGSLSPSLLGMVEIRNLLVGDEESPLLSLDRFYLEYSLWDLLRGKGLGAVRNLSVEEPALSWNTGRDRDLLELFGGEKKKALHLPPECTFLINRGRISFVGKNGSLSAGEIFLEGGITKGRVNLEGSWHNLPSSGISLSGNVRGGFSTSLDDGNILIGIDSLEGEGFALAQLAFTLSFFDGRIVFERSPHPGLNGSETPQDSLELVVEYFPATGDLSGVFRPRHFLPGDMVRFSGPLEQFSPFLDLRLSGEFVFSLNVKEPENPEYRFDLSAEHKTGGRDIPLRSFVIRGRGDGGQLTFSRFQMDANRGSVRYEGRIRFDPFLPLGSLSFSNFSTTGKGGVNGALVFSRAEGGFGFRSSALSLGELSVFVEGELLGQRDTTFTLGIYPRSEEDGSLRQNGSCTLEASFTADPALLEGSLQLREMNAGNLLAMARPFVDTGTNGMADRTALTADLFFSTDFKSIAYRASRLLARFGKDTLLSASFAGTDKGFKTDGGGFVWSGGEAAFGIAAAFPDFSKSGKADFAFTLSYRGFDYVLEGGILDKTLRLRGTGGFQAVLHRGDGGWNGSASAAGFPLPLGGRLASGGQAASLSFDSSLRYRNAASWNVSLGRLEILKGDDVFFVRGQASQNGLNLDRIFYEDREGPLEGSAAAVWNGAFSLIDGSFFLADRTEREKLSGEVFYEDGLLEFHGQAAEFRADRFMGIGKNLRLSGDVHGSLNGEGYYTVNLSMAGSGRNNAARTGDGSFTFSGLALFDPERIILSQLRFAAAGIEGDIPYLQVDRASGSLEAEGRAGGRINAQDTGLNARLGVNFRPLESWLDLKSAAESFSGILEIRHAFLNKKETSAPFSFVFSRIPGEEGAPGVFRLSGGPDDMMRLEFQGDGRGGTFETSFSAPSPVQGTITGVVEGTVIDALAREVYIDLPGLWETIPVGKTVNFTGGFITGETRISGSIFDPEFSGSAWGSGVALAVPGYVAAEIGPGSGEILLEGSDISFGPVAASCGEGEGLVSGWVRFNRWVPSIGVTVEVDREIPFDFNISGIAARGKARGYIDILMENDEILTFTGDITAEDTELALNEEEIRAAAAGGAKNMDVVADIHITAGRRVEFLWPNPRSPLLRAYAEMGTGVQITGDTRIPHFALDGDVNIRGGELYQLQRSFYIREGQLHFSAADPQIDPRISARAELRDRNDEGPVTIAMVIENARLSALVPAGTADPESPREIYLPRFESTPSLSQVEIYSILGQAPSPETTDMGSTRPFINTTSEIILQSLVFRRVERPIRNILGLDMFSFRTQILQNAIFEAVRSREPDERSGMGNYLDNTAVFLGKYIGQDLFFQTTLTFRYDQYRKDYGGMRLEPDLGLEFRTPLFDIRWSLRPQAPQNFITGEYTDPVADIVSGQSISLVWRWSW